MRAVQAIPSPTHAWERRTPPRALSAVRARLLSCALDRQLAHGVQSWRSPVHAARALQLTGPRGRASLARSLDDLVEHASLPRSRLIGTAIIQPCREQVWDALPQILALTARLRDGRPVGSRGVAAVTEILRDGAGPCYRATHRGALTSALERVSRWLDTEE